MQQLPDTPTKSTQNISKSFEVPIQHQQYFVPNLPPQCDTNTTICLKTLDIDAKRYIAINIATLCVQLYCTPTKLDSITVRFLNEPYHSISICSNE